MMEGLLLTVDSAVKTPGAAPVIESMGMADVPNFFTTLEQSIDGMVDRVSRGICAYLWPVMVFFC